MSVDRAVSALSNTKPCPISLTPFLTLRASLSSHACSQEVLQISFNRCTELMNTFVRHLGQLAMDGDMLNKHTEGCKEEMQVIIRKRAVQ